MPARLSRCLLAGATALVTVSAACSSGAVPSDEGRWTPLATPTGTVSSSSTASSTPTPSSTTPAPPAAVARELDELARNLRDLSQATSSRDAMDATASALAATRADVKRARANAYGSSKSCGTVEAAVSDARVIDLFGLPGR